MTAAASIPFALETLYQARVWGGYRLGDGIARVGEAWGAYEGNRIASGPLTGATLREACELHGEDLLGPAAVDRTGRRFPLLTKLLDAREWLSVQIHPNDEQAERLEGAGQFGKTEAWHLIETDPGAELIVGLRDGVDADAFERAVRESRTLDVIARQAARAGDTWFIPAGTVHALGPGIFLYEVQQTSDITYRVYDWDRPASEGRALHIEQAIQCVRPTGGARAAPPEQAPGRPATLVSRAYFVLEQIWLPRGATTLDTGGTSFHALTVIDGAASVTAGQAGARLATFDTAVVPAAAGVYRIDAEPAATIMIARGPEN